MRSFSTTSCSPFTVVSIAAAAAVAFSSASMLLNSPVFRLCSWIFSKLCCTSRSNALTAASCSSPSATSFAPNTWRGVGCALISAVCSGCVYVGSSASLCPQRR